MSYDLLPNGTVTAVPGTGSSVTVQFGTLVTNHTTTNNQNYTSVEAPDASEYTVSAFVPWPASSSGLRGAYLEYSTDSGATWHLLASESHPSNTNTNASTVNTLVYMDDRSGGPPSFVSTTQYRLRAYQNSGSSINLSGSWLKLYNS